MPTKEIALLNRILMEIEAPQNANGKVRECEQEIFWYRWEVLTNLTLKQKLSLLFRNRP
jgi:hypothetical protein